LAAPQVRGHWRRPGAGCRSAGGRFPAGRLLAGRLLELATRGHGAFRIVGSCQTGGALVFVEFEKPRTDWAAELAKLPEHPNGGADWVGALNASIINPKPGLDEKAEPEPELDLNVELVPKDMPDFKVTYPHKIHTQLLACTSCHTEIFQMQAGADPITMEKIFAGEYCGRCHGKVAFDPTTACQRCHREMPQ
jgi:c(7)-type cytochrome triheme protein